MESNFVHVDIVDNLAIIELDDPSANTLTFHLLQEVEQQFLRVENNPQVHGVVLIGKGEKLFFNQAYDVFASNKIYFI